MGSVGLMTIGDQAMTFGRISQTVGRMGTTTSRTMIMTGTPTDTALLGLREATWIIVMAPTPCRNQHLPRCSWAAPSSVCLRSPGAVKSLLRMQKFEAWAVDDEPNCSGLLSSGIHPVANSFFTASKLSIECSSSSCL